MFINCKAKLICTWAKSGTIEEDEPIDLDEIDPESELIAVDDDTLLELEDFDLMGEAGLDCEWIE